MKLADQIDCWPSWKPALCGRVNSPAQIAEKKGLVQVKGVKDSSYTKPRVRRKRTNW
jgi:hypothetical protein